MDQMSVVNLAGLAFIGLLIFLVCRELVCWYWKLNRIVQLLEQIANQTKNEKIVLVPETKKPEEVHF